MNTTQRIYVVSRFVGSGYTAGKSLGETISITEWSDVKAFIHENDAEAFKEELERLDKKKKNENFYYIKELPIEIPIGGIVLFPEEDRIFC